MKRKGLNTVKRILCVILSLAIAVNVCSYNDVYTVNAAEKTFPLAMAKNLAMTNSKSCRKLRVQISMKKAKYAESVKKLTLKRKNQSTFRWSPLLSFKFPETPDLVDEFEYAYKPLSIQSEIDKLKHELSDAKYAVYEEVTNLYVNIYTLQEKIAFDEKRLETINDEISSNEAKVVLGLASQSDVDSMKKSQKKLNDKLASEKRDFENKKKDMKALTKLDVTTGYKFENPYIDISISRANLDDIKQHTLENDNGLYEAKITKDYNLTALNTSYKIMKNWYGSKMSTIDSFVSQARAGQEIDEEAFKNAYDKFMSDADAPWDKEFKLWLIFFTLRFPFEYLKGERSGTRYIENEPYMLYTSCLEYVSSIEEEKNTRIALEKNVDSGFENIVTTRNAYLSLVDEVSDAKKACEKAEYLNSTGKLSYEDYQTEKENYENVEIDMLDALDLYTQTLTSYDRLTCGAITNYLKGTGVQLDTAVGGDSYLVPEVYEGAYYYIKTRVSDDMFELNIHIPEDFSINITDFELWCDDQRIGERTPIDSKISHLTISKEVINKVFIRLYDNEKVVDDCEINPMEYSGELNITGGYRLETQEVVTLGTYSVRTDEVIGKTIIRLNPDEKHKIAYFVIKDSNGTGLFMNQKIPIGEDFEYLSFLGNDLESVKLELLDEGENKIFDAYFDTSAYEIKKEP